MPNNKYAPTAWGDKNANLRDLNVPSGQVCQIKRVSVETLMGLGILDSVDSLTAIVSDKFMDKKGNVDPAKIMSQPSAITDILGIVDQVVVHCVVQPQVALDNDPNFPDGAIPVSAVGLDDKMAIFEAALEESSNLEQFRDGPKQSVGRVGHGKAVGKSSK